MRQKGVMRYVAVLLLVLFLGGLAGTIYFWPSSRDQRIASFFSLLQFVAAFALVLLTFIYVRATQIYVEATHEQLKDQNREPQITVLRRWYPQIRPFVAEFVVEIANPSVRATSISIKSVQIGEDLARHAEFLQGQTATDRVTIPARDLLTFGVKATFDGIPIFGNKSQLADTAILNFEDVFHGRLRPAAHKLNEAESNSNTESTENENRGRDEA